jgi:hypothetical protein
VAVTARTASATAAQIRCLCFDPNV